MFAIDDKALVGLLDAVYDGSASADVRVQCVLDAFCRIARSKSGTAIRFHSGYLNGVFTVQSATLIESAGPDARWSEASLDALFTHPFAETGFGRTMATTCSDLLAAQTPTALFEWDRFWASSIADSFGMISRDACGEGIALVVGLQRIESLTDRQRRVLTRFATHVGAGYRLPAKPALDDADAVLTPNGKLLHAAEPARIPEVLAGVERCAFARKSRHDAETALEAWQGLVDGTWSIVDHFDTDGKRLVLAMKNAPEVAPRAELAPQDRRVAALAAMGHRDKEIAYSLGITMGSVAAALRRARAALRVKTRAELAAAWRRSAE